MTTWNKLNKKSMNSRKRVTNSTQALKEIFTRMNFWKVRIDLKSRRTRINSSGEKAPSLTKPKWAKLWSHSTSSRVWCAATPQAWRHSKEGSARWRPSRNCAKTSKLCSAATPRPSSSPWASASSQCDFPPCANSSTKSWVSIAQETMTCSKYKTLWIETSKTTRNTSTKPYQTLNWNLRNMTRWWYQSKTL